MAADVTLTLAEAAEVLDPPITIRRLRAAVRKAIREHRLEPEGHRYTGHAGRPAPTYNATRLMELHAELVPPTPGVMS